MGRLALELGGRSRDIYNGFSGIVKGKSIPPVLVQGMPGEHSEYIIEPQVCAYMATTQERNLSV